VSRAKNVWSFSIVVVTAKETHHDLEGRKTFPG